MAEAALFSVTSVLIKKLGSPLLNKFGSFTGFKKDFKKLQSTFTAIQSVLKDAEEQQWTNNAIRDWLEKLKDVAYDIEDLLDEIEMEDQDEIHDRTVNKVRNFFTPSNPVVYQFKMNSKIRKVVDRLDAIAKERFNFNLSDKHVDGHHESRTRIQTHSYVHESEVYGRGNDREKLVQLLTNVGNEEEENISVIPIVGMGGLGKTTLAKLVFNDKTIMSRFNVQAWAFVSENYDQAEILRAIIASATKKKCDLDHMDPLQSCLREILNEKKYLLVLDDVWNENQDEWLQLKALLKVGARGSKVLVTTRSKRAASLMSTCFTHELEELPEDDCWSLFKQQAFPQRDEDSYPNLLDIGKDITKRCRGVPLAIKALGGMLHDKRRESDWVSAKDSEIWKWNEDQILPTLKLSYNHLPSHLKRCFAFMSVFPKGYGFKKNKIITMWIAEGFIQSSEDGKSMEDIGEEYFDELCCRSFLQKVEFHTKKVKPHDLVHDLARSIGRTELLIFEAGRVEGISERTRHLSLVWSRTTKSIDSKIFHNAPKLRTFVVPGSLFMTLEVLNDISSLTRLRVLDLSNARLEMLPNSIGKLKHLRYLSLLNNSGIESLPASICNLRNLWALNLEGCRRLRKLPNNMCKMISIRHLEIELEKVKMIKNIGKLGNLQTLAGFQVGKDSGRGIHELQGLNLRGSFKILGLENVLNPLDAEKVKLRGWQSLRRLSLTWETEARDTNAGLDIENCERVIESLQPHSNLQALSIFGYMGSKFPRWLMHRELPNLIELCFCNCTGWEVLPPVWELHNLEVLEIWEMPNLVMLSNEETMRVSPHVKGLTISDCPQLAQLPHLPALEGLTTSDCPNLAQLPHLPALKRLTISSCSNLAQLPHLPALERLRISYCPNLAQLSHHLALKTLKIQCCPNLAQLSYLPALGILKVQSCPNLAQLSYLPALKALILLECHEEILMSLEACPAIISLEIWEFPKMTFLPEFKKLTLLEELYICYCPGLLSLPKSLQKLNALGKLHIEGCPLLEDTTFDEWEDWRRIKKNPWRPTLICLEKTQVGICLEKTQV